MVVTVKFVGLDIANGEPKDGKWIDKGNGVYEYKPSSAGDTPLNLVSTVSIPSSEERTNYITFSAKGFKEFKPEIKQRGVITITIPVSSKVTIGTNQVNTLRSISIGNSGSVTYGNYEISQGWLIVTYYQISFTNLVFTGPNINDDTQVTIVTSQGANGTQRTTTTTIGKLRGN